MNTRVICITSKRRRPREHVRKYVSKRYKKMRGKKQVINKGVKGKKIRKNVSLKTFLFGDFDKDGIKNIDDPYPLTKKGKKKHFVNILENPKYYHKSRFVDPEVKLSEQLLKIKKYNDSHIPKMNKMIKKHKALGRIKSVPSTLKKLVKKYTKNNQLVKDIAGTTILVENRKEADKVLKEILKRYKHDPAETDNFYDNPKDGVYHAHHVSLLDKNGKRVEVQIKSKKLFDLHKAMHPDYKAERNLEKWKKKAEELVKQGY